jgi:hypothetical protein
VELVPRAGRIVSRDPHGKEAIWDLATTLPPTLPTALPAASAVGPGVKLPQH